MTTQNRAGEPDRTLFVGNLDSRVKEEILYELFLQAGPVSKVTICKDKDGNPKSFGFVCFKHTESVPYAMALLNGIRLYGRPIKVQYRFDFLPHRDFVQIFPNWFFSLADQAIAVFRNHPKITLE
uniref:Splicing regulator RBM11 n=1 Tax=Pseudonaja textilis TaxID=8673 RepID=A0A670Y2A6_PSETE